MKTIVYIDGQNFLYKAAEILIERNLISDKQDLNAIDIRGLLGKMFPDEKLEIRFFGIAKIRRSRDLDEYTRVKASRFSDNLRRLKNSLAKQNIEYVASGVLLARDSEPCEKCGFHKLHFLEKGVDVSLATSLVNDAATDAVDRIILVSSDMDMLPALILVREKHQKQVIYVGFEGLLTPAIRSRANSTKAIKNIDVVEAFLNANQKA